MASLKQLIDRGIFLRKVDSFPPGVTDDGVTGYFIDGENYVVVNKESTFKNSEVGIWPDGSDMTTRLQQRLNNSAIKEIEFDVSGGGSIIINGTLTVPTGKVLSFKPGTKLTGTGTINGGIFRIPTHTQAFDITLNLTNVRFEGDQISVKWFGAVGNNSNNDQPAIQKAIDVSIYNATAPRTVYFPMGSYKIDAPLILAYKIHLLHIHHLLVIL